MKSYFAYIRVSTLKQGEKGVSLQEQRSAIEEFAKRKNFQITTWFEEHLTAAKRGRPIFTRMIALLMARKAAGVIMHKIDRSARNLRDWTDMAELMDRGVEVHFAHEGMDLHSRSGRLSADILAVVAADYIRNLREETRKGFYGRLKQGLYPIGAPVGYLNNGGGKPKTIDPIQGPLIKLGFELYTTQLYSLNTLAEELFRKGLRNKRGHMVTRSPLNRILRNPFYIGLIRIWKNKESFAGVHAPIINSSLFNKVQWILDGKRTHWKQQHSFLFRRIIRCAHCKFYLVGELQKGHVYYRCHTTTCPKTSLRQERFEEAVLETFKKLIIQTDEEPIMNEAFREMALKENEISAKLRRELKEELSLINQSIERLLYQFLLENVSKELFDQGNTSLLMKRKAIEEKLAVTGETANVCQRVATFINNLCSFASVFVGGKLNERRSTLDTCVSSILVDADEIRLILNPIMNRLIKRIITPQGWCRLIRELSKFDFPMLGV